MLKKNLFKNLIVWLGAILFFFIGAEIICRLTWEPPKRGPRYYDYYIAYDNLLLGWWHRPYAEGLFNVEGCAHVKINSKGLRDYKYDYEKKKGVFRIAVLGDSFTEALQAPLIKTFPKILETKLNQSLTAAGNDKPSFEVLNFGCMGYGTAQEYLLLQHEVKKYRPDLVILAFCLDNDVEDNNPALSIPLVFKRPYYVLQPDGQLKLDDAFKSYQSGISKCWFRLRISLLENSYFATFLYHKIYAVKWKRWLRGLEQQSPQLSNAYFSNIFVPHYSPLWQEAWETTKALIYQIKQECETMGDRFLLVSISHSLQVLQLDETRWSQMLQENPEMSQLDLEKPERFFTAFCQEKGINYFPLAPAFREYYKKTGRHLHGFHKGEDTGDGIVKTENYGRMGHWNLEAHRLAAELIYQKLMDDKLIPKALLKSSDKK